MEHVFRGKAKTDVEGTGEELLFEKGQWAYGNLIWNNGAPWIVGGVEDWDSEYIALEWWVAVDPETVGMCTGLKDHTKDDIYDGDILRDRIDYQIGYVEYDEDSGMFAFYVEDIMYGFADIDSRDYEIIGNIYDNPELLGEV